MELEHRNYEPFCHDDAEEERRNFLSVLAAFRFYRYTKCPIIDTFD